MAKCLQLLSSKLKRERKKLSENSLLQGHHLYKCYLKKPKNTALTTAVAVNDKNN